MAKTKAKARAKASAKGVKAKAKKAQARVSAAAKNVRARAKASAKAFAKGVKKATTGAKAVARRAKAVATRVERVVAEVTRPKWIAQGYEYVNPYLIVRDMKAEIDFLCKAFGFAVRHTMAGPDGSLTHAELLYQGQVVMMGPGDFANAVKTPKDLGGTPVSLYVYCENADAMAERAVAAGAQLVHGPNDEMWGDRIAVVIDPEGYRWSFATHVKDVDLSAPPPELEPPATEPSPSGTDASGGPTPESGGPSTPLASA